MFGEGTESEQTSELTQRTEIADRDIPAAITDTGCERDLNEDRYAVVESRSGIAWIVCDGMGGAAGGELAAQLAIDAMRRDLENAPERPPAAALKNAILEANRIIVLRRQNPAFASMGTTIVAVLFSGPEVVISHLGDSRAYLVRDGAIQQLTTDHTYVQELVDAGKLEPEDALSHPQAHILTKCIGSEPGIDVDVKNFWVWHVAESEPRDAIVLCSDGLYSLVTDGEIANLLAEHAPQQACVKLVELAKARGGYDNITTAIIPLPGQLKREPPIGYNGQKKEEVSEKRKAGRAVPVAEKKPIAKYVLLSLALSGLAMLVTILMMVFAVSR